MTNYLKLVSIEIGNIADNVVSATFSNQIVSLDFSAGITIKVNGTISPVLSVKRLNDQRIFQYTISQSALSTDTVTFSYLALPSNLAGIDKSNKYGDYISSELGVVSLEDIGTLIVTNNVQSNDPIGDALRADCVSYWKMDEVSGTREDSTINNRDMASLGTVNGVTGKINNAAQFTISQDNALTIFNEGIFDSIGKAISIVFWVKPLDVFVGEDRTLIWRMSNANRIDYWINYNDTTNAFFLDVYENGTGEVAFIQSSVVVTKGVYYFIVAELDRVNEIVKIRVNDTQEQDVFFDVGVAPTGEPSSFVIGAEVNPISPGDAMYQSESNIDEVGFWNRLLTIEEKDYLYNSGTGRMLYS